MEPTRSERTRNGSRLALVGAIVYLLEWAFIIPSGVRVPPPGSEPATIAASYAAQAPGAGLLFAGLIVALLGRIAFAAAVRNALRHTNETRALGDLALGVMVVSVALEIAGEAVRVTTTRLAAQGAEPAVVAALHQAWDSLTSSFSPAVGVSIGAASLAMLLSRDFPRWLALLGILTGAGMIGLGFYLALINTVHIAFLFAWLAWVVWLLSTGIILFRRAGPIRSRSIPA